MNRYLILTFLLVINTAFGQIDSSALKRPNLIKFNISSHILYSTSCIFSYERVLKNNSSFAVSGGYLEFPHIFSNDSIFQVKNNLSHGGYMLAGEYRFYLVNLNKFSSPKGVYLGPYVSYYHFHNSRDMILVNDIESENFKMDANFNIMNLGFQLGYQFIIKDRWIIDFVFAGPSLSFYQLMLKSDTPLDIDKENEIIKELISKFPMLEQIIDESEISFNNSKLSWGPGYRYLLQVGYKFGFRNK